MRLACSLKKKGPVGPLDFYPADLLLSLFLLRPLFLLLGRVRSLFQRSALLLLRGLRLVALLLVVARGILENGHESSLVIKSQDRLLRSNDVPFPNFLL